MAATKQTKQTKPTSRPAPVPTGWSDETSAAVGKKGEFFRFEPGASLRGVVVGPKRAVKSRYGSRDVRDVETADGEVWTVEPKAFAARILSVPAGTEVMLTVAAAPEAEVEGSSWSGRLLTRAPAESASDGDVPF